MFIDDSINQALGREPNITFSAKDYEGFVPHDDDPMVITLQIVNWDSKIFLVG